MYDYIIVGGGPAGTSAAVYAARKRMKTLLITESFGGQSIVSADIENWIGEPHISGYDLAKKFEDHVRAHADIVEVKSPERAVAVRRMGTGFEVETDAGRYQGRALMLAAGARRRKLGVPGEKRLDGKGVAYCSTCDAPIFKGKEVAVVGGGNAGLEAVTDLLPYASRIYLLEFGDALKGDPVTQDHVKKDPKVTVILNAQTKEVVGETSVTGLAYVDRTTNSVKTLEVQGVFVEIGSVPNSDMVKGVVDLDRFGQVVIDSKHGTTSIPGIFAAGDITDDPYKQNNISAGDAVKATLAAYGYLLDLAKAAKPGA
jgi:alkyl hydroperoxide reductase subunit F